MATTGHPAHRIGCRCDSLPLGMLCHVCSRLAEEEAEERDRTHGTHSDTPTPDCPCCRPR